MRTLHGTVCSLLTLCLALAAPGCGKKDEPGTVRLNAAKPSGATVVGYWSAEMKVPGSTLRLGFDVQAAEGSKLTATFDSFDQGVRDLPATGTLDGSSVVLDLDLKQGGLARFDGQLSSDGHELTGNWRQGPGTMPLTFTRGDRATAVAAATRPQTLTAEELEQNKAAAGKLSGTWGGALNAGGTKLRIQFDVATNSDGTCTTTMRSLDQGGAAIPVKQTLLDNGEVTLKVPGISGKYVGIIDPDGTIIDGTWTQGGGKLPLTLEKK